ncbi:Energy-coupling factor transporter transmembrane protein EcfT [Caloramator mitchellensis]|uniref:Energy-coupling factor transporter transmembrane protein EcfT n=1 Tax=Caloramator mitchellensis TaxID=908809 RepID=A0A0R3K0E9_CALMK|nr:energy-coupling factor transporter transmembrane component T [Caloramator mitchellensis]KRQ88013.1 Energy-coupling factor transporter transmembrane protein EcfT [Caloramator mitchellensis]
MTEINSDIFLKKIHPLSSIIIIITYLIVLLTVNNIIYLSIIILSIFLLARVNNVFYKIYSTLKFSILFGIIVVLFNFILNPNGETILFIIFDRTFTLESLFYGFFMAVRLIASVIVFAFANHIIEQDDAFSYFSNYIGNSALLMSMMFRLIPRLTNLFNQIKEIEILRGNNFKGNFYNMFKGYSQVINILFLTSLEESVEIAESMYSKCYGSKNRTVYHSKVFYRYDFCIIAISASINLILFLFVMMGFNDFKFYPVVINPVENISAFGLFISIIFFVYSMMIWWWKHGSNKIY